jgi:hypothetical protein
MKYTLTLEQMEHRGGTVLHTEEGTSTAQERNNVFQSSSGRTPEFLSWQRDYRRMIAAELPEGWIIAHWSIMHFEISAFLVDPSGAYWYLSCSDVRFFPGGWYKDILIRTAKGLDDYTGGRNCFTTLENLWSELQVQAGFRAGAMFMALPERA